LTPAAFHIYNAKPGGAMVMIIAARFEARPQLDTAVSELKAAGFAEQDIEVFYVAPSEQHRLLPAGGDEFADRDTQEAGTTAPAGVAAGAVAGALVGKVVVGAPVGGDVGSFAGALADMKQPARWRESVRLAAQHVAVRALSRDDQERAIEILCTCNAQHVEQAHGSWRDGH
jgi:hypothetical protein